MKALIVVDLQNDFCEGGSLAVPNSLEIFDTINTLIKKPEYLLTVLTRDWHKWNQRNFASVRKVDPFTEVENEWYWPDHCVEFTHGAQFHDKLRWEWARNLFVFTKGTNSEDHPYSGFEAVDEYGAPLDAFLHAYGIERVDIVGLAYDFCVKDTAIDAAASGFEACVIDDGTRAVYPDKNDATATELREAGVIRISSKIKIDLG